jgi:predicted transposase YdaD
MVRQKNMRMASSLKLTRKTGDECKNEVCVVVEFGSVETGKKVQIKDSSTRDIHMVRWNMRKRITFVERTILYARKNTFLKLW